VSGNSTGTVLFRAMMVMLVGYALGRLVGLVAQRTIDESIAHYRAAHPIPDETVEAASPEDRSASGPDQGQAAEQPT
jgi:hypothetical protein